MCSFTLFGLKRRWLWSLDALTDASEVITACMRAKEMKQTAVLTLWLSQSSCAFSDTDITTKGQVDHRWWPYSQTLGHHHPKISTDTLGSRLDTLHFHSCRAQRPNSLQVLQKAFLTTLMSIQAFFNLLTCWINIQGLSVSPFVTTARDPPPHRSSCSSVWMIINLDYFGFSWFCLQCHR